MVTDTPEIPQTTHTEPRPSDTLSTNRVDLYMLSPSARTSFTRVDTMVNAEDEDEDAQAETEDPTDPAEESDEAVDDQASPPEVPQTPQVSLTFLLVSGKRRSMTFDPETTVGRSKELVWNAWPKGAYSSTTLSPLLGAPGAVSWLFIPVTSSLLMVGRQIGRTSDRLRRPICGYCTWARYSKMKIP